MKYTKLKTHKKIMTIKSNNLYLYCGHVQSTYNCQHSCRTWEQNIPAEQQSVKEQHKLKDFFIYVSDHFNKFQWIKDSTICHTKTSIIWITKVEPSKESLQLITMLEVFRNCSYFKLASPLGRTLDCLTERAIRNSHW